MQNYLYAQMIGNPSWTLWQRVDTLDNILRFTIRHKGNFLIANEKNAKDIASIYSHGGAQTITLLDDTYKDVLELSIKNTSDIGANCKG